jgi:hypothetical protein
MDKMTLKSYIFFLLICFFSFFAYGEYRVFQYLIFKKDQVKAYPATFITTTLDPVSFSSYHGGIASFELMRSWMCYGDTSRKNICYPAKKEKIIVE